jgi:putative flippase GtrA
VNRLAQWLRYGTVSIVATVTSLSILGLLVSITSMPAGVANLIATAVGTVPSFELNRRWVWNCTERRSLRGQVLPFWLLSFGGLALSTLTVTLAAAWASSAGVEGGARTLLIELANLAAWGSLWVAQFVVLDRFLFRTADQPLATARSQPDEVSR